MLILGGWAIGNFAVSGTLLNGPKSSQYYRCQMNVMWNVVNVALAGIGYCQATKKENRLSLTQVIDDYHSLQRKLLFNAGLDVAYVVGGVYLLEKAKNELERVERWRGYGQSLVLQGGFLFIFDSVFYQVVRSHGRPLKKQLKLTPSSPKTGFTH